MSKINPRHQIKDDVTASNSSRRIYSDFGRNSGDDNGQKAAEADKMADFIDEEVQRLMQSRPFIEVVYRYLKPSLR